MKKLLFLILLTTNFSVFAKANSKVLFDTDQYQIKCDQINCQSIVIVNSKKDEKILKDSFNDEEFNLNKLESNGLIVTFYKSDIDDLRMGRFLRVGYSLTGTVDTGSKSFKQVLEKCAILDLETAQVKQVGGARDEICFEENYLNEVGFIELNHRSIKDKSYLYTSSNMINKSKMYLIKGDKVTLLDEKTDDSGQKWYFINYKGKKDLNMWIKAEAVDDLEGVKEKTKKVEPTEKSIPKKPEPVSQTKPTETIAPLVVAKQKLNTKSPQKSEAIIAKKIEATKKSAGSFPLSLLAPLFGLLVWRMS